MPSKITVIIPVYNASTTLEKTLQSVLSQSMKDIEIICIDDSSTDNTPEILAAYAQKHANIVVHAQVNGGAGAARNYGIRTATGEFIAFMDADDWYPRNDVLELLYTKAKEHNVHIAGGSIEFYKDGKVYFKKDSVNSDAYFQTEGVCSYADYQFDYYYQRFIYEREFLIERNLVFPDYRRFEDPLFFAKAMQAAGRFYATKLSSYCCREVSKPYVWNRKGLEDTILAMRELLSFSKQNNLTKLHRLTTQRIENDLPWLLNYQYTRIDTELQQSLEKLDENIDKKMLGLAADYLIRPLRNLREIRKFQTMMYAEAHMVACVKASHMDFVPKVSVVVPVYNVELYLPECLESLIHQTLQEIEIICVDDGSTDGSLQILQNYAEIDNRISIYTQENSGPSVARNNGVKVAQGKYVQFLDSDDYLDFRTMETLYTKAEQNNLEIVLFSAQPFGDGSCPEVEERYAKYYHRDSDYPSVYRGQDLLSLQLANHEYLAQPCLYMFSRELAFKNMIAFVQGILHEDNAYTFTLLFSAKRAGFTPELFYHRRLRPNSIMTVKPSFYNSYGYFRCYRHIEEFMSRHKNENDIDGNIWDLCYRHLENARTIYATLQGDELVPQQGLNAYEATMFKHYVVEYQQAKSEITKLKNVQKQRSDEITKLKNDQRQKNDEIVKLKNDQKLKSDEIVKLKNDQKQKNDEIVKLKDVQKQKNDEIVKLKDVQKQKNDDIAKLKATVKKRETELKNIKEGTSFRIGRAITYIPRKITGRK